MVLPISQILLGSPVSNTHQPNPVELAQYLQALFLNLTGANAGALIQTSKADLDELTPDANTMAWVIGDADSDLDGVYQYASVVWTKRGPLPYSVIQLNNADEGTANAIEVSTAVGIPSAAFGALYILNVAQENTGAVTVSINGAAAKPLISNTGAPLQAGALTVGMALLCIDDGTSIRLLVPGDIDAIIAAAEAILAAAEALAGSAFSFPTEAAFEGATIPSGVQYLRTAGHYAPGEGGGGVLRPALSTDVGAKQSADGQWWKPGLSDAGAITVRQFGAKLDGVTDDTDAFQRMTEFVEAEGIQVVDLGSGRAKLSAQISLPPITYQGGDLTLDFSHVTSDVDFANDACIYSYGGDPIALASLASDVTRGAEQITLTATPGISPDDLICIFNPLDGSLNDFRIYYKDGQYPRVLDVSGNVVTLTSPILSDFAAADVDLYKYPDASINFCLGRLRIAGSDDVFAGVKFHRLQRSCFDRLSAFGAADTEIQWYECVDGQGRGIITGKNGLVLTSLYGGYVSNCQGMDLEGKWAGGRHGITLTGTGAPGFITPPCRDIRLRGEYRNMPNAGDAWHSFNAHGNCIGYDVGGTFHNGIAFGGNRGKFSGSVNTFSGQNYGALLGLELHGTEFDFELSSIETRADPGTTARGLIDVGGNTDPLSANTKEGGRMRFKGAVRAPNAERLIRIRNRGATVPVSVDLSGLELLEVKNPASGSSVQIDAVSGDPIAGLKLNGFNIPDGHGWSVGTVQKVSGWRGQIKTTITTDTAAGIVSATVAIKAPKVPAVAPGLGDANPGGALDVIVSFNNSALTSTAIQLFLRRASGNFPGVEVVPVHAILTVDE